MADDQKVLGTLVALKRRRAEQRLALAHMEMERGEEAIQQLIAELHSVDSSEHSFDDRLLSLRKGRTAALTQKIESARAAMAGKRAEVEASREALKLAFYSEEQIHDAHGA